MKKNPQPTCRAEAGQLVLFGTLALSLAVPASAKDLFEFNAATTDALPPLTIIQGTSNLPDRITELVDGTGQFNQLNNREFVASLRYGSVPQALRFNIQQVGGNWAAQLTSPFDPVIINRNFSAATRPELEDQIDHYLEQNGLGDLAKLLSALDRRTIAGALDGNPVAATSVAANAYFGEYGLRPTETEEESTGEGEAATSRSGIAMTADAGTFRSEDFEGETYSWTPMVPVAIGESRRVRLEVSLPLNYTSIEGADQFRVGGQMAVAMLLKKRGKDQPWLWQVTPHAGALVAGSLDMLAGGVLMSGGATSYLSYRWNRWEFSMGNHASFHEGLSVTVDDYEFDPDVSQQILKNGLKVGRSLGQRWYAEGYVIDTEFLQDAFISRYLTVGAGVGYRGPNRKGYVMIGLYGNFGDDYSSGNLQFGTGWKF